MASNLVVKHRLLTRGGKIRSRRFTPKGSEHFNLRIFVDGDTSEVARVKYELHPTFKRPIRTVQDPDDGFAIDIWTWGEFDVPVSLELKDGTTVELVHSLAYSDELPSDDAAYTNEGTARE